MKLGYIALNVTERSHRFYETVMGLQVSGTGAQGEVYLRCSGDHHNIVLYPAQIKGIRRIGWQILGSSDRMAIGGT